MLRLQLVHFMVKQRVQQAQHPLGHFPDLDLLGTRVLLRR